MTKAELDAWGKDYRRRLDHKLRLERIRREGQQLRDDFAKIRRKEESISLTLLDSNVKWAHFQAAQGIKPFPLHLALRFQASQRERHNAPLPDELPHLGMWQAHIEEEARALGVTIRWTALPGTNAYAFTALKQIEIAPIRTSSAYCSALHEAGHCARPCPASHARLTVDAKAKTTCCPTCEVAAWRWAIARARPTWTRRMHEHLGRSLKTYRNTRRSASNARSMNCARAVGTARRGRHARLGERYE